MCCYIVGTWSVLISSPCVGSEMSTAESRITGSICRKSLNDSRFNSVYVLLAS